MIPTTVQEWIMYAGALAVLSLFVMILFQGRFLRLGREYDDMRSQRDEWHTKADASDARADAAIEEARLANAALRDALEQVRRALQREARR